MKKILIFLALFFTAISYAGEVNVKVESSPQKNVEQSGQFEKFLFEKLQKYTDVGEKTIEKVVDELKEQSPIVVDEYLTWKFYESLVNASFQYIIILIWIGWLIYYIVRWNKKVETLRNYDFPFWHVLNGAILLFSFMVFNLTIGHGQGPIDNTLSCVKIKVAPKVYLIEKAVELIKK